MGNNTGNDNTSNITNIIWIDPKVDNEEIKSYLKELKNFKNTKISSFKSVMESLTFIKKIKFSETFIIISGSLYTDFIEKFKENLKNIFIIPKIIIFAPNKEQFVENNINYNSKYNSFYNLGGIHISFEDIKNFLLKSLSKLKDKDELTFEYIDCKEKLVLPLLYQSLIEITSTDNFEKFTEYLYNKYSKNKEINILLNSIKNISDIPRELLSKYYARLYTIESQLCYDINKKLRGKKREKYISYVKLFYEGVKLKSLPLASDNILYRGSKISNDEIIKIKEYLKNKIKDLPGTIVFSKSFLSFTKDKNVAEKFYNNNGNDNNNENLSKVLYIIEKEDKIDYSLSTHSDIENISMHPDEREVLFFPFSSFEIKDINEKKYNDEKIYEIKLLYLGKYLKELENLDENIPDNKFKKEMIESGLIPEKKMKNTKEVIEHYKEYKNNINNENFNKTKDKKKEEEEEEENKNNINIEYKDEINITYNIKNENDVHIFGKKFVENNKDKCKIVFENKEYELNEYFKIKNYTSNKLKKLQIQLKYLNNVTNMHCIFQNCTSLSSLSDISKWNINNVTNMKEMFSSCTSLSSLPDISKWNTNNVTDMSYMFSGCSLLSSLPDISKWNTKNVTNMSSIFNGCTSLSSLPDISKWNTNNITNMSYMFYECKSLSSLPDISKWNTKNVTNMRYMFSCCISLLSLPDISKWNTNKITNISYIFNICTSLSSLPDISKWNTNNIINMSYIFRGCTSLLSLPDISKWNTNNVTNMSNMFYECESLSSLPDISKWNTNNVTDMSYMFRGCKSLLSLPDISKWNIKNVTNMNDMFFNCKKKLKIPSKFI